MTENNFSETISPDRIRKLLKSFEYAYGYTDNVKIIKAPGRVNLIGEHTDYNDGYVLPVAIDREILLATAMRGDRTVQIHSMDFNASVKFTLDSINHDEKQTWSNYPRGAAHILSEYGYSLQGMDVVITGNIPQGAGLSSSAALEVATAFAFKHLNNLDIDMPSLVRICQEAENSFVGVNCGIMDQFVSALGKENHALFLDCRTLEYSHVPLPESGVKIIVGNTGVKRGLVDSAYNERRQQCEEGVRILMGHIPDIYALRDVTTKDFNKHRHNLPEIVQKRCEHVITENERVLQSTEHLKKGNLDIFGRLLIESHESLRDKYEVSCKELDIMVDLANSTEGVIGSRMTGAGFGGCTVSLVKDQAIDDFINTVGPEYEKVTGIDPEFYICKAVNGAEKLPR